MKISNLIKLTSLKAFAIALPLFIVLISVFSPNILQASNSANYSTLKKYLGAKMYGEAYMEILLQEVSSDTENSKIKKLRKDLLKRTQRQVLKKIKLNPDDSSLFTILADISFQQGKYDEAIKFITPAIKNNPTSLSHYVFSKILFQKGNIEQSFDQMSLALDADTDSIVIFDAFQFLYSCKSYGISTAKKICKKKSFLNKVVPLANKGQQINVPESPFINDPTQPPVAIAQNPVTESGEIQDPTEDRDNSDLGILDATINKDDNETNQTNRPRPMPDDTTDIPDDLIDSPLDGNNTDVSTTFDNNPLDENTEEVKEPEQDPEEIKIKSAEHWFELAQKQYGNKNYTDAKTTIDKAISEYPAIKGGEKLSKKIDIKLKIFADYQTQMKKLHDKEQSQNTDEIYEDKELEPLLAAWNENPKLAKAAPYFIGKIYLLKDNPEKDKALKYFNIVINSSDTDSDRIRNLEWIKIEILTETKHWQEANSLFNDLFSREEKFVKLQPNYRQIYYTLWYYIYKIQILAGMGIFAFIVIVIFLLQLLPAISGSLFDPGKRAKKEFNKENYEKAADFAAKALSKSPPIQIARGLLEIQIQSHFHLKSYVRCQECAKSLLEKFPDNNIAWAFLAKASISSQDTSGEAILMYENLYKENPNDTEYLPILANHYSNNKVFTVEAMNIMFTYYQSNSDNNDIIQALAEGYTKNKTMGNEVVEILLKALETKEDITFRELLARNYSKTGKFLEASRECLKVLENNINNMGIHVVYTSSMKKMNMLDEALMQYEEFAKQHPNNPQIIEIITGLKKDLKNSVPTAPKIDNEQHIFPESLKMPNAPDDDLPEPHILGTDLFNSNNDNIPNSIPDGFDADFADIPLPDFLKEEDPSAQPTQPIEVEPPQVIPEIPNTQPSDVSLDNLATLSPFEDNDSLLDGFDTDLPEELGGPTKFENLDNDTSNNNESNDQTMIPDLAVPKTKNVDNDVASEQLGIARTKAKVGKWDEVIEILSPVFASDRNKDMGMLLIDAYLQKKEGFMAMEIVETLDLDPELMDEGTKDILYRVGNALEASNKYREALKMYDTICNVDINYKDAFDRSDKLYNKLS